MAGPHPSRRDVLGAALAAGAAFSLPNVLRAGSSPLHSAPPASAQGRSARIVHLSDVHMTEQLQAPQRFARCMDTVRSFKPDLILTGGDLCHGLALADRATAQRRVDLLSKGLQNPPAPIHHCLGNHDHWAALLPGHADDPMAGQGLLRNALNIQQTSYSLLLGGWHILVLDNVRYAPASGLRYEGQLSQADLALAVAALTRYRMLPSIVVLHIPPVSVLPMLDPRSQGLKAAEVGYNLVCREPTPFLQICRDHGVRAVLSGHLHRLERLVILNGLELICGGAVCGQWWQGPNQECPPGFGLLDCFPDGRVDYRYIVYESTEPG